MNRYIQHCPEVESYQFYELFILQNILLRRYTIVKKSRTIVFISL